MARKGNPHQSELFEDILLSRTAPCVPALREAVASWRASDYKGITDTTRELLNYWFFTEKTIRLMSLYSSVFKRAIAP